MRRSVQNGSAAAALSRAEPPSLHIEAFDLLPDAVLLVRRDRIAWVSAAAARLLGRPATDLSGAYLHEVVAPEDLRRFEDALTDPPGGSTPPVVRLSFLATTRTGGDLAERVAVDVRLARAGTPTAPIWVVVARDAREADRRARDDTLREVAAIVAHEVRTPVGVLLNVTGALRRVLRDSNRTTVEGGAHELLQLADEEAHRLRRLVESLLDFTRPYRMSLERFALSSVVSDVLSTAMETAHRPVDSVHVEVELPQSLPPLETDRTLVAHALTNLLTNAFEAVPQGGRISLSARADPDTLRIRVYNDGRPILADHADRVFEPFFTTKASGAGLGLTVARRVIEALGGRVTLDAEPAGVAFSVWLPLEWEAGRSAW